MLLNKIKKSNLLYRFSERNLILKEFTLKKLKNFNKSLIKYNIILKTPLLKKKKKLIYKLSYKNKLLKTNINYKIKNYKMYKSLKKKKYFNTRLSLKQYKNNFFAIFSLRNAMKRYYSTGLFFKSGPKKSSTYAAQLVGKLMGRYMKKTLRKYRFKLKIRNICLSLKTRRNAFTYACLKGIYRSKIWFGVYDPSRKNSHGYIRLRKPRSL